MKLTQKQKRSLTLANWVTVLSRLSIDYRSNDNRVMPEKRLLVEVISLCIMDTFAKARKLKRSAPFEADDLPPGVWCCCNMLGLTKFVVLQLLNEARDAD